MTDIEFDEIDKAVSSALGDVPAPGGSLAASRGKSSTDIHVRSSVSTTLKRPSVPARRPNSGRFMDVVTPSASVRPVATERPLPTGKPAYDFPRGEAQPTGPVINSDNADDQPMSSPFLSDAKVEKRPLGAFSDAVVEEPNHDESISLPDEPDQPLPPTDLNHETMGIELDHLLTATTEDEDGGTDTSEPTPAPAASIEPPVPSIIQQYQEQPSTATTESGAMFDTDQYHAPLTPPAKKTSGWMVVIWILVLIVIGAGLGAAAYYFVLPTLL